MDTRTKRSLYITLLLVIFSATVVSECQDIVKLIFDEGDSPVEYFLYAFKSLNETCFMYMYPKNDLAHGYFKQLLNSIDDVYLEEVTSPIQYCGKYKDPISLNLCKDIAFKMFVRDEIEGVEEISGMDAFRHVYLTQIFENLKVNIIFPPRSEAILLQISTDVQNFIRNSSVENQLNNKKIEIIKGYFNLLFDEASSIARTPKFPVLYKKENETIEEFEMRAKRIEKCKAEIRNAYGQSTTSRTNFLDSLKNFNQESFSRRTTNTSSSSHVVYIPEDDLVLGFFKDLLNRVSENDLTGLSPSSYCNGNIICLDALTKLGCGVSFSGLQAFRHVYLTHVYSEISKNINFSEQDEDDVDLNKIKINIILNYVDQLYDAATYIDPSRLPSVLAYCEKVC